MQTRMLTAAVAAVCAVLLPAAVLADDAPFGNKLSVAAGFGNRGQRIHIVVRYSIFVPNGCPQNKPYPFEPEWKTYWSAHCAAYRTQRARLILRIYRVSPPHGLAFTTDKRVHGKAAPFIPFDEGGIWATDVFTRQFQTGCYSGRYSIKATLIDPYHRPDFSAIVRFVCR